MRFAVGSAALVCVGALCGVACGGLVSQPRGSGGHIINSGEPTVDGGVPGTPPGFSLPSSESAVGVALSSLTGECSVEEHIVEQPLTEAVVRSMLVRSWILCTPPPSVFGTSDDVGLEIDDDGTWAKLLLDSNGNLTKANQPQDAGTWELLDISLMNGPGVYDVSLSTGAWNLGLVPFLATSPLKMVVDAGTTTYVAAFDTTPAAPPDMVTFQPDLANCASPPPTANTARTTDEFQSQIVGTWAACNGSALAFFYSQYSDSTLFPGSTDVGLELTSTQVWHRLFSGDTAGTVVRGHGFGRAGVVRIMDMSSANWPGSYQLDLITQAWMFPAFFPEIASDVMSMIEAGNTTPSAMYVRVQ